MSARESTDRFFEATLERQEAIFDAIRGINDRYYRFARSVIEGTRNGVHDWTGVLRRWSDEPTDLMGLYEAASEAYANGQARRLALWQEVLEDLSESQRDSREVVRRGFGEVREAVERVQESAPAFLRQRISALRRDEKEPVAES